MSTERHKEYHSEFVKIKKDMKMMVEPHEILNLLSTLWYATFKLKIMWTNGIKPQKMVTINTGNNYIKFNSSV